MRYVPPSLETISALPANPLRVLVSGCIAGLPCGTDGTDYGEGGFFDDILKHEKVRAFTFCPEEFSFGTPRATPDCVGGNGFAVLAGIARVVTDQGDDWTEGMIRGAKAMRDFAMENRVDIALLQHVSGACGTSVIYDGLRSKKNYQIGPGVAAAALIEAGITVVGTYDRRSIELLRKHLSPEHQVDALAHNQHEGEWYRSQWPEALDDE